MKTVTSFLMLMMFVFIGSSGLLFIMQDIASKNSNLNDESVAVLSNLKSFNVTAARYQFTNNTANYSLTGYETVDAQDKDNSESKGTIEVFLFMKDSFFLIPLLAHALLPFLPLYAFAWLEGILLVMLSYFFTIAIYNAWKGRRT